VGWKDVAETLGTLENQSDQDDLFQLNDERDEEQTKTKTLEINKLIREVMVMGFRFLSPNPLADKIAGRFT